MSQTYNLGKVAITPRGAYSSTAQYTPLDILSYNGSSYLVLQNCMGVTPPNATYYMVVASKGDTGSAGASPTIAAGTVKMTPAGTSASVTNVGTNVNASFNFTLPSGNVIYTGTGVTGTSTTPTIFSGSGVENAGVGDIYFNTNIVAFYQCTLGGVESTAKWVFLTYAVPDGSISASKVADSAITSDKIADGAVGEDKLSSGAVRLSKLASDVTEVLDNKANVDGAYEQMTVGNAEQLVSTVGITNESPYLFRTSGGSVDIGDRENDKIVGGTVAWNQMLYDFRTTACTATTNDGVVTITPTGSSNRYTAKNANGESYISVIGGHKYLQSVVIKSDGEHDVGFQNYQYLGATKKTNASTWTELSVISNATSGNAIVQIYSPSNTEYQIKEESFNLFDLTAMFGSTIADYAYTLESNTAGSGIAWLKSYGFFTKPYYPYAAANLQSVKTSAHRTVGFNQWDKTNIEDGYVKDTTGAIGGTNTSKNTGYIRVVGGLTYHVRTDATLGRWGAWYDSDKNYISAANPAPSGNMNITAPQNAAYLRSTVVHQGNGNPDTFCINLHWDGERDGEYEPYVEHAYPLDDSLTLRGIFNLDANNNLYADGDIYPPSGEVQRRYGIVTLNGSESTGIRFTEVSQGSTADGTKYVAYIPAASNGIKNGGLAVCDAYLWKDGLLNTLHVGEFDTKGSYMRFVLLDQTITTLSALNTYLASHPLTIVFELETPTTESADPYTNPQIVDDWGTEEYVDTRDVPVPVGHTTLYTANLRAKVEMMPNSPNGDGLYAVRQSGGINTYEEIIFPTELPSAPTSDGTYRLVCTVADGVATYSWTAN